MIANVETLEDFFPDYPPVEAENFAESLFSKKEFADLKLPLLEDIPTGKGQLFKVQKLVQRLISPVTPYRKMLVHAEPGVGKSCMISAIIENFKDIYVNGMKRKPAIIVVPSDKLASNIMREISEVCTDNLYKATLTARHIRKGHMALTENMEKRQFRKVFEKTYKVVTHEKFFMGKKSNHTSYDVYSNRIICIDEVHKIREYKAKAGGEELYDRVFKFLHSVRNSSILLFTGTFIWDSSDEFASTFNLLLPKEQQIPISKFSKLFFDKGELTEYAKKHIKNAAPYYIYIRAMEADIPKREIGTAGVIDYYRIFPTVMSSFQSKKVKGISDPESLDEEDDSHDLAYSTTLVFPKYENGKIVGYFKKPKDGYRAYIDNKNYEIRNEDFAKTVREDLETISGKLAGMFHVLDGNPKEKAVVYDEFVKNVGTTTLAAIFRARGYEIITSDSALDGVLKSKKKRVMIIAGQNGYKEKDREVKSGPVINNVVKASKIFNDPRNMYGEYCRAIIGSKMIVLGYSFKDVRQFHIIEHHWNDQLMEQALSRGYRTGSFENLPVEDRYYRIFRLFAVHPGEDFTPKADDFSYPPGKSFSLHPTRDFRIYEVVQKKSIERSSILHELNRQSPYCALVYSRNVLGSDIDFSRKCHYKRCNYECQGVNPSSKSAKVWEYKPKMIDESGFLEYYSSEELEKAINVIKAQLIEKKVVPLGDFSLDRAILYRAIHFMIENNYIIRDSLGKSYYLGCKKGNTFLTLDSGISTLASIYYTVDSRKGYKKDVEYALENSLINDSLLEKTCDYMDGGEDIMEAPELYRIMMFENLFEKVDKKQFEQIFDPIKDRLYKMEDGTFLHDLYVKDYSGSYNVMKKLVKANGKFRVYEKGEWKFLRDPIREAQYEKEVKNFEPKREYVKFGEVIGLWSSKDNSFRIKYANNPKGRMCTSLNITDLAQVFMKMGFPKVNLPNTAKDLSKDQIIEALKVIVKSDLDYDDYDKSQLSRLLSFVSLGQTRSTMCPLLLEIFSDNKKLNYI